MLAALSNTFRLEKDHENDPANESVQGLLRAHQGLWQTLLQPEVSNGTTPGFGSSSECLCLKAGPCQDDGEGRPLMSG